MEDIYSGICRAIVLRCSIIAWLSPSGLQFCLGADRSDARLPQNKETNMSDPAFQVGAPPPPLGANMQYCPACSRIVSTQARACPGCGAPIRGFGQIVNASDKCRLAALLLCFFLGTFGVHRFYVGKIGTGLIQLFTLGLLGVWTLIDLILIIVGAFSDKQGRKLLIWTD
jgi:TM2 domain-containing membrane protein YozV